MSYSEDDLIQLSSLQHTLFCPRQCALIHVEQVWSENLLTAEGRIMHEHVHEEGYESRGDVRIERGVSLRSLQLGLIGKVDVIEYHRQADGTWQHSLLNTKEETKARRQRQRFNSVRRLCVWKKCLTFIYPQVRFSMAKPEDVLMLSSMRRCGGKRRALRRKHMS
jgi:CRISPR-associated exonuclease Cas4